MFHTERDRIERDDAKDVYNEKIDVYGICDIV